jgi:hypothetical protein
MNVTNADGPRETSSPGLPTSARRINAVARELGATRYLEIGVSKGKTFLAVNMPKKTAVDPRFRFDAAAIQTDEVHCHEMTSDEWFLKYADGETFDIIFLDGLHTFEQTFRDFCNSLLLSHANTVWIIDDTMPGDIYSSCRNQKMAIDVRRKDIGRVAPDKTPGAWSGDVYKLVFAIHDFFSLLSYRTILHPGKPQTIVWRRRRSGFVPLLNDLAAISQLTYFDFQQNLDLFQGGAEEDVLKLLFDSLASTPAA